MPDGILDVVQKNLHDAHIVPSHLIRDVRRQASEQTDLIFHGIAPCKFEYLLNQPAQRESSDLDIHLPCFQPRKVERVPDHLGQVSACLDQAGDMP
ncbi:hypothetical protein D3C87_1487410 [compost metagenome]